MKPSHLILDLSASKTITHSMYWGPLFFFTLARFYVQKRPHYKYSQLLFNSQFHWWKWKNLRALRRTLPVFAPNLFYLKKNKTYAKLKYSRTPAVDLSATGSAALFAGIIGFLFTEKAGFEMVDSGDFFYTYCYLLLISLIVHPHFFDWRFMHEYTWVRIFHMNTFFKYFLFWKIFFSKIFW